ncbi:matrix metalloproteinase-9-like [Mixophyes fleayi]|uniref:matrix metalloproteinase-9-like n=1 Tax=Mixophyes fleayi TaxID=3061075 RepID=UPI003F4E14CD
MNNMLFLKSIFLTLILELIFVRPSEGLSLNVTSRYCVFPFSYARRSFDSCIPNNRMDHAYWCSKTMDYDLDLQWEFCTVFGAVGSPVIAQCTFPFIFEGKSYNSCTKEGRSDQQLWCSTTPNYDKDGHWIFCTRSVSTPSSNSKLQIVMILCLGFVLLCVCFAGCCMRVHWRGVKNGLWWSSRRVILDQGKDTDDMTGPEPIYENTEVNETTHI